MQTAVAVEIDKTGFPQRLAKRLLAFRTVRTGSAEIKTNRGWAKSDDQSGPNGVDKITIDLLLPSSNRGFGVQRFQHVTSDKAGQNRLEGGNRGNQWQPKKVTQRATQNPIPGEDAGNANPDSDFRFDVTLGTAGGYIFNQKTTGMATGTYNLNRAVTRATGWRSERDGLHSGRVGEVPELSA